MKFIASFTVAILLFGCNSERNERLRKLNSRALQWNTEMVGQVFQLDTTVLLSFSGRRGLENRPTILTYYDADCSVCFEQLSMWLEAFPRFQSKNEEVDFKFILSTTDLPTLTFNLDVLKFPKEHVLIDAQGAVARRNAFLMERAFSTLLLDENQRILFIGSPILSNNINLQYLDLLQKK